MLIFWVNMDNQWSIDFFTILIAGLIIKEAKPIKITSVEIPSIVRAGTDESTILDCGYDMESSSNAALVVKWYINQELLYQWIHGSKPKGSDEFQQYIDETYKASSDPNTMYRAVKLVRPGHELSGKVRCSISSQDDEAEAEGNMIVYSTEKLFRLSYPTTNGDSAQLTVTCLAEDLYPLPNLTLHQDNQLIPEQKQYYKNKTDGRFSVEVMANLQSERLKLPTTFRCEVYIRDANYTSVREYTYNSGSISNVPLVLFIFVAIAGASESTTITY